MLTAIHPKLPMRNKDITRSFYIELLGFKPLGKSEYDAYLMLEKDQIQIHFFLYPDLDPKQNDGQVYLRSNDMEGLYQTWKQAGVKLSPLEWKPWGLKEFSLLDPDHNLLTIGEEV